MKRSPVSCGFIPPPALVGNRGLLEHEDRRWYRIAAIDFERIAGCVDGIAEHLDVDTDFLVRLRAQEEPSVSSNGHLILPMTTRNEMSGAVVLGRRTDGGAWRPDQVQELVNATRDVGQDLQMLEIDLLQEQVAELSRQLDTATVPIPSRFPNLRSVRIAPE